MRKRPALAAALWLAGATAGQAAAQEVPHGAASLLRAVCLPWFERGGDSAAIAARALAAGFAVADESDGTPFLLEPPAEWFDLGFTEVWLDPGGGECSVLVEELAGDRTAEVAADLERWIAERRSGWRFASVAPRAAPEEAAPPSHAWESSTHTLTLTRFHQPGLGMSIEVDLRRKPPSTSRRRPVGTGIRAR